jgi:uncharacterized short protein YbdD (DUF466 family)
MEVGVRNEGVSSIPRSMALVVAGPRVSSPIREGAAAVASARLMVGQPDYDAYVEHMRRVHPERPIMSFAEFFRDRQDARYGGKGGAGRCC